MPTDGYFESDGARLHYLDWGGDGPPLLLLHATMMFGRLWQPVVEALGGRFRIITPDQRAHGDSEKPDDGYDFETFARDQQALLQALGLENVVAAAHSSGGTTIALHAAMFRGVIERMVLFEPILVARQFVRHGPNPMADQARKRRPVWPGREEMLAAYRGRPPFNTWREDVVRLYVEEGTSLTEAGAALKCPPEYEARFYEAVAALDPWPYLERIACPTLVAWSEHGRPAPAFDRDAVGQAVRGSKTIVIPSVSHFAPMERPDDVARVISEFLLD